MSIFSIGDFDEFTCHLDEKCNDLLLCKTYIVVTEELNISYYIVLYIIISYFRFEEVSC